MNFHVMTLFPDMILNAMNVSITGRAVKKGLLSIDAVDIRDFSKDRHRRVDDYPYGGGAGMLMLAQPVYDCYMSIMDSIAERTGTGNIRPQDEMPDEKNIDTKKNNYDTSSDDNISQDDGINTGKGKDKVIRTVFMTPAGKVFDQKTAADLANEEDLIILCGHYEGIDQRVIDRIVTDEISIGDYVLTGGELPALVLMDTVSRLVPGVLNNAASAFTESHGDTGLLEYPQYTRPEKWMGEKVPDVLLSGNHAKQSEWYREQSVIRTAKKRPDLIEKASLTEKERKLAESVMHGNDHFTENM